MIIVSQDKTTLFPFNEAIYTNDCHIYAGNNEEHAFYLGRYADAKRAREVLQEILSHYDYCRFVYEMPEK